MGTTLTGTTPQDTYDSLIKVTDNGPLSGTAKYLSDGLGNDSVLALSNAGLGVGTTTPNIYATTNATNAVSIQASGANQGSILDIASTGTGFCGINMGNATIRRAFVGTIDGSEFGIYTNPTNTGAGVTERLRITSAGNVGIGTSNPVYRLDVQTSAGNAIGNLQCPSNSGAFHIYQNGAGNAECYIGINNATATLVGGVGGVYGSFIAAYNARPIAFGIDGSERMRVTTNGLTFNGDTAAANALDDYEEGTFTPTTSTSGYTISASNGSYTKIGRQVSIRCQFTFSAVDAASTSAATIGGLPFTSSAFLHAGIIRESDTTGAIYACVVNPSATTIFINSMDGVVTGSQRPFGTNENYVLSVVYFV